MWRHMRLNRKSVEMLNQNKLKLAHTNGIYRLSMLNILYAYFTLQSD